MMDYRRSVNDSLSNEYEAYKSLELKQDPEQIFEDCHRYYLIREITDYPVSEDNDLPDEHYRCLYKDCGYILPNLWDYYLKSEYATVDTWQDIEQMIRGYNGLYHSQLLKNESEM